MKKKLDIEIKNCEECPYFKKLYTYGPGTRQRYDLFECNRQKDYNHLGINPDVYKRHNFIHEDCPLKDVREQGVMVGVSVFLINDKNQILVGKRAEGTWGLPGGGMDAGETPKEAGVRETLEETAIDICEGDMEFATFTNDIFLKEKNEHWITLYFICRDFKGKPKRVEPDKCEEWRWVDLDDIPKPVFCDWAKNVEKLKILLG